jgi:hypothetical protein
VGSLGEGEEEMSDGYSGLDNPVMSCPCRNCKHSGIYGGEATRTSYLCPYNKRLTIKALENINGIIGVIGSLFENLGITAGVKLECGNGFTKSGEVDGIGSECPVEGMNEESAMRNDASGASGKIKENGG